MNEKLIGILQDTDEFFGDTSMLICLFGHWCVLSDPIGLGRQSHKLSREGKSIYAQARCLQNHPKLAGGAKRTDLLCVSQGKINQVHTPLTEIYR
jgi:hypothetical protein